MVAGQKILDAAAEAVDRTIRTFDQVRDSGAFVLRSEDILGRPQEPQAQQLPPEQAELGALMQQFSAAQQAQQQGAQEQEQGEQQLPPEQGPPLQ